SAFLGACFRGYVRKMSSIQSPGINWYAMGTDPKQCRERALRCTELAERASAPSLKAVLSDLADRWLKSAVELERAESFRDKRCPPRQPRPATRTAKGDGSCEHGWTGVIDRFGPTMAGAAPASCELSRRLEPRAR